MSMADPFTQQWEKFIKKDTQQEDSSSVQKGTSQPDSQEKQQKKQTKKWTKISLKSFLIGCIAFIVFVVWLTAGVLFLIINNPDQFTSVGLDRSSIQRLLQTFTVLFFGFIFFFGFGVFFVNIYRLLTVKNKPKLKYAIGTFLWFFVLLFSIGVWALVIREVQNLNLSNDIDGQSLVVPYIMLGDGPRYVWDNSVALIAPLQLSYQLNTQLFNRQVYPTLWPAEIRWISLVCGNDRQILPLNIANAQFQWSCLYINKWDYSIELIVDYVNNQTAEQLRQTIPVVTFAIPTAIEVNVEWGEVSVSDNELVVGKVPRKVWFNADDVFVDLGLDEYLITRDADDDGEIDRENNASYTHVYNQARVYNVNVRFPWLNNALYTFPLRVEQSDVPVCQVTVQQVQWTNYSFQVDFLDNIVPINAYGYTVQDRSNNSDITTINTQTNTATYDFPWAWMYAVKVDFVTEEGKQWSCESMDFSVWAADFVIDYTWSYKNPQSPQFTPLPTEGEIYINNTLIVIRQVPTILKLEVDGITPASSTAQTRLFLNDTAILSSDGRTFEVRIDSRDTSTLRLVVEDEQRDARTEKEFSVQLNETAVIGKLLVRPDTSWTEPFAVEFDASTTTVNDPDDEIIYFSRDFGDGEVKQNTSQWVISHTYAYDYENENWIYEPSVTLVTKKNRSVTIGLDSPILVKKPSQVVDIRVDSHPAQVVSVWDRVDFVLDVSWLPTNVRWNFGNGQTLECEWRQCLAAQQTYDTAWTYSINVVVEYTNQPTINGNINIEVQ